MNVPVTMTSCPCCNGNLIAFVGTGADMAMRVHWGVRFQWKDCPVCGYDLEKFFFMSPVVQGQAQIKGGKSGRLIKP